MKKVMDRRPKVDVMIEYFCNFCPFSAKKIGVFLKTQCYDQIFANTSSTLSKIRQIWRHFFGENISKITTSVVRYLHWPLNHTCTRVAQSQRNCSFARKSLSWARLFLIEINVKVRVPLGAFCYRPWSEQLETDLPRVSFRRSLVPPGVVGSKPVSQQCTHIQRCFLFNILAWVD
jgi:hypothetical protein